MVALPGILALFLVARAFIDANRSDIRYAGVVALLMLLSFFVPKSAREHKQNRRSYMFLLVLLNILLLPFTVIVLIFGHVDMAGFVFHLIVGVGGTPWRDMAPFIVTAIVFHAAIIFSVWSLLPILDRLVVVLPALITFFLIVNPLVSGLFVGKIYARFVPQPSIVPEFVPVITQRPDEKPNLVIIYLEGFDYGYMDAHRFGDMAAPLRRIENMGMSFINVEQIAATGWSLAGTVATQCGVPLMPHGAIGEYDNLDRVVPGVRCLPEILEAEGYTLSYTTGSAITGEHLGHYGYGAYFSRTETLEIFDETAIRTMMPDLAPALPGGWGIPDGDVFAFAKRLLEKNANLDQPFAMFVATMDTHGPKAVVSPQCTHDGKGHVGNEMGPSVECTARLAENFVTYVKKKYGDSVKIALMSDHLNHMSDLTDRLEQKPRRNTVILLDSSRSGERIERAGSMVDVFPTMLDWLGFLPENKTRAALGTSLLSDDKTLVERIGSEELNRRLFVDTELTSLLWKK